MGTILRIDASARAAGSHSRELGDHFERAWLVRHPGDRVVRRDLAAEPLPHVADRTITGFYTPVGQLTGELREATALSDTLIEELQAADVLLLTVPIYNFSVPSALKAWIDQVVRIGRTFSYDGAAFTGLVTRKRAYAVLAYGAGGYAGVGPLSAFNFLEPYLKTLLAFLGVEDVRFFAVEATTGDNAVLAARKDEARHEIDVAVAAAA